MKDKDNICNYHYQIKEKAVEILRIKDNTYNSIEDLLFNIQSLADDIYKLAEKALSAGESMEYRLKEYKEGIEYLGFERVKNKKK